MTYHHLSVLIHRQAEKYGDKVALKYRDYETSQWIPITWNKFSRTVRQAANALVALGTEKHRYLLTKQAGLFIYRFCCLYQPSGYHTAVCYQLFGSGPVYYQRCSDTFPLCGRAIPV